MSIVVSVMCDTFFIFVFLTAVDVVIQLKSGGGSQTVELSAVNGDVSTSQLEALIREKVGTTAHYGGVQKVMFKDIASESGSEEDLVSAAYDIVTPTAPSSISQINGSTPWIASLWAGWPRSDLKVIRATNVRLNQPGVPVSRDAANMKFRHWVADVFEGLQTYKEHGNGRLAIKVCCFVRFWCVCDWSCVAQQDEDTVQRRRPRHSRSSVKSSATSKNREDSNIKQHALEAIQRIEFQIKELENEKRVGKREIDDIELDIHHKRQEIGDIRKKYLNYFYYF